MKTNKIGESSVYEQSSETPTKKVEVSIEEYGGQLYIRPQGYGDIYSAKGEGVPILLEVWEGKLRLVVWSDIKQEDPTHIISLEKAQEPISNSEYFIKNMGGD